LTIDEVDLRVVDEDIELAVSETGDFVCAELDALLGGHVECEGCHASGLEVFENCWVTGGTEDVISCDASA
jgi:hypothetical protein